MQLRADDLVLSFQQLGTQQLALDIFKAQTLDGIRETLAGLALFAEEQDCLLDDLHHLFLRGKHRVQRFAVGIFLTPASADIDAVSILAGRHCLERAGTDAATAVVAQVRVNLQNAVHHLCCMDRTGVFHLADLTAAADVRLKTRDALTDHAQIVEVWLDAVVWAASDGNLEFVRQLDRFVAFIEAVVNLSGEVKAVQQSCLLYTSDAADD